MTNIYRKIYEKQYGPIPKDHFGRTYDIHHIDGDKTNNDISNLKCVSIKEHYDIHFKQGDWNACLIMSARMKLLPDEISRIASKIANEKIINGTHHFLNKEWQLQKSKKAIKNGNHNFLSGDVQRKRIKRNDHPFVGENNISKKRVKSGVHQLLGGKIQRESNAKRIANGTHNFLGNEHWKTQMKNGTHSSQIIRTCPHCNKIGKGSGMKTWHFDKCKFRSSPS